MKYLSLFSKARDTKGRFTREESDNNWNGYKIYYDRKGYATVWLDGKNKKVHILEWESKNGSKPKGMQLHHLDEDKGNWDVDNLVLVNQSDHFKIHAGWVRECGEWIAKPCKDCEKKLPLEKFYERKTANTPSHICKECSKLRGKKMSTPAYREYRKKYSKEYYQLNKHKWLTKNA